jgi:hypothetical protein
LIVALIIARGFAGDKFKTSMGDNLSIPSIYNSSKKSHKMSESIQLVPGNSLITKTPEEGRQLAIKMARLIIKSTQPDAAVREKLRPLYANDAAMLIAIGQTVATEFATIAAANNYWRLGSVN